MGNENFLVTNGPRDLFKLIFATLDIIKNAKIRVLYERVLILFKECILQYLIANNYLIRV